MQKGEGNRRDTPFTYYFSGTSAHIQVLWQHMDILSGEGFIQDGDWGCQCRYCEDCS